MKNRKEKKYSTLFGRYLLVSYILELDEQVLFNQKRLVGIRIGANIEKGASIWKFC